MRLPKGEESVRDDVAGAVEWMKQHHDEEYTVGVFVAAACKRELARLAAQRGVHSFPEHKGRMRTGPRRINNRRRM